MHVHASDRKLTEGGSAKFFVKENGDTTVVNRGKLNDRELSEIQKFIKKNYKDMYLRWREYSNEVLSWRVSAGPLKDFLVMAHEGARGPSLIR